ncbi:MAG: aldehyde dehydrogenase family protein [Pleomorphochaeta sp.]
MLNYKDNPKEYVSEIIERSRAAQKSIEFASQEEVDKLCAYIACAGTREDFAKELATLAQEESKMGRSDSKFGKIMVKVKGVYRDVKGQKSVGIIEEDHQKGLVKIAKPMGVIGALIPCTNPEATPFCKAVSAIKTRNSIVMCPHPRTKQTGIMAANKIRETLKNLGYPEDLVIMIDAISLDVTDQVMKQCDVVLATGGSAMVKAAYSSGTPSLGVGAGNAAVIVDETVDIEDVADKIYRSKTFDNATSCSAENEVIIHSSIYQDLINALINKNAYLLNSEEKEQLKNTMWIDGVLNRKVVAQKAIDIAKLAKLNVPENTEILMVEGDGIGEVEPFSGEKLSVVMTLYKYDDFNDAIQMVNDITDYSGAGHSCGLHSTDKDKALLLGTKVKVSRIMINQPQCLANSGAWTNGMPMTMSLGCGSWGGNSSCDNISWKNMLNTTWVSFPIASTQPSDEELFTKEILDAVGV